MADSVFQKPTISVRTIVRFECPDRAMFFAMFSRQLRRGEILLKMETKLPVGTPVEIEFHFGDCNVPVMVPGQVYRHRRSPDRLEAAIQFLDPGALQTLMSLSESRLPVPPEAHPQDNQDAQAPDSSLQSPVKGPNSKRSRPQKDSTQKALDWLSETGLTAAGLKRRKKGKEIPSTAMDDKKAEAEQEAEDHGLAAEAPEGEFQRDLGEGLGLDRERSLEKTDGQLDEEAPEFDLGSLQDEAVTELDEAVEFDVGSPREETDTYVNDELDFHFEDTDEDAGPGLDETPEFDATNDEPEIELSFDSALARLSVSEKREPSEKEEEAGFPIDDAQPPSSEEKSASERSGSTLAKSLDTVPAWLQEAEDDEEWETTKILAQLANLEVEAGRQLRHSEEDTPMGGLEGVQVPEPAASDEFLPDTEFVFDDGPEAAEAGTDNEGVSEPATDALDQDDGGFSTDFEEVEFQLGGGGKESLQDGLSPSEWESSFKFGSVEAMEEAGVDRSPLPEPELAEGDKEKKTSSEGVRESDDQETTKALDWLALAAEQEDAFGNKHRFEEAGELEGDSSRGGQEWAAAKPSELSDAEPLPADESAFAEFDSGEFGLDSDPAFEDSAIVENIVESTVKASTAMLDRLDSDPFFGGGPASRQELEESASGSSDDMEATPTPPSLVADGSDSPPDADDAPSKLTWESLDAQPTGAGALGKRDEASESPAVAKGNLGSDVSEFASLTAPGEEKAHRLPWVSRREAARSKGEEENTDESTDLNTYVLRRRKQRRRRVVGGIFVLIACVVGLYFTPAGRWAIDLSTAIFGEITAPPPGPKPVDGSPDDGEAASPSDGGLATSQTDGSGSGEESRPDQGKQGSQAPASSSTEGHSGAGTLNPDELLAAVTTDEMVEEPGEGVEAKKPTHRPNPTPRPKPTRKTSLAVPAIPKKSPAPAGKKTPAPAPTAAPEVMAGPVKLSGVSVVSSADQVTIRIDTDRKLERVLRTELKNPNRLVLDLLNAKTLVQPKRQKIGAHGVKQVRFGVHSKKLRIVVDLSGKFPEYDVQQTPKAVTITLRAN